MLHERCPDAHGQLDRQAVTIVRMRSSLLDDQTIIPRQLDWVLLVTNIPARLTADQRPAHGQHTAT